MNYTPLDLSKSSSFLTKSASIGLIITSVFMVGLSIFVNNSTTQNSKAALEQNISDLVPPTDGLPITCAQGTTPINEGEVCIGTTETIGQAGSSNSIKCCRKSTTPICPEGTTLTLRSNISNTSCPNPSPAMQSDGSSSTNEVCCPKGAEVTPPTCVNPVISVEESVANCSTCN